LLTKGLTRYDAAAELWSSFARNKVKYRADIDGLRGVAVALVVLFHARLAPFGGGFVGVDVFFVISGYLITLLITSELEAGSFTLAEFYRRRIRRIFPALFVVMGFCGVTAWAVMAPFDYRRVGDSIFATSIFSSNIFFWWQSGYFDTASAEKPLLHTWSLAVEEQFYLIYPLYLLAVTRLGLSQSRRITVALLIASFLLGAVAVFYWPSATFYLAPTRAWELLLGALLAMGVLPPISSSWRQRDVVSLAGAALILVAAFEYTNRTRFPGLSAILPATGAFLVIWGGTTGEAITNRMLAAQPVRFVGLISYSLYLWHFPLLAFASYLSIGPMSTRLAMSLIGASVALASLTWWFIERPARSAAFRFAKTNRLFYAAASISIFFCGAGLAMNYFGDLAILHGQKQKLLAGATDRNPDRDRCFSHLSENIDAASLCRLGTNFAAAPSFLLWGDSHAEALRPAIDAAARSKGIWGYFVGWPDCPPLVHVDVFNIATSCPKANASVLQFLAANTSINTVIMAARWSWYAEGTRYQVEEGGNLAIDFLKADGSKQLGNLQAFVMGLESTVIALKTGNREIWIVGPVPEVSYNVPKVLYEQAQGLHHDIQISPLLKDFKARQVDVFREFDRVAREYTVKFVWPHEALCDRERCEVEKDGSPLYFDTNHMSVFGARSIAALFDPIFN
jgi:peptidoglycan/LPS O-acetylase OafA/YrhL